MRRLLRDGKLDDQMVEISPLQTQMPGVFFEVITPQNMDDAGQNLRDALSGRDDFVRIPTEPQNSLVRQHKALLATEGATIDFDDSAVNEIAAEVNSRAERVGARRLHTIPERLLDDISFHAPELSGSEVKIDAAYVREKLGPILEDQDLSRYIL